MVGFGRRDEIREAFGAGILAGRGLEIGAGAFPQALPLGAEALYYDVRTDAEAEHLFGEQVVAARSMSRISLDFPDGADFLIAHNVLEHCPDPIGVLVQWNRHVRRGGRVVMSLPHHRHCPDAGRRLPPLSHLIGDFLSGADGRDFSSREHSASFTLGWAEDFCSFEGIETVKAFSRRLLEGLHRNDHDLHWHALDTTLSLGIVKAAAAFDATVISDLKYWSPDAGQTVGDIIISYTIAGRDHVDPSARALIALHAEFAARLDAIATRLAAEIARARAGESVIERLAGEFRREGRYCFVATLPPKFIERIEPNATLSLWEDDRRLGPSDALHDEIRRDGHGRCSFWKDDVYFSSSDGTDCMTNGRLYSVRGERKADLP